MKLLESEGMEVYTYPENGMLDCNTYIVKGEETALIDPGSIQTADALAKEIQRDGIDPNDIGCIVNTHLHLDHCMADDYFRELSGAEVLLHPLQKRYYSVVVDDVARFFGFQAPRIEEDGILAQLKNVEIISTPGHSPDSICFLVAGCAICGDVIFKESVGRVDLPGGDGGQLRGSIKEIEKFDIHDLLPGHMGVVRGAEGVRKNFRDVGSILSWL